MNSISSNLMGFHMVGIYVGTRCMLCSPMIIFWSERVGNTYAMYAMYAMYDSRDSNARALSENPITC